MVARRRRNHGQLVPAAPDTQSLATSVARARLGLLVMRRVLIAVVVGDLATLTALHGLAAHYVGAASLFTAVGTFLGAAIATARHRRTTSAARHGDFRARAQAIGGPCDGHRFELPPAGLLPSEVWLAVRHTPRPQELERYLLDRGQASPRQGWHYHHAPGGAHDQPDRPSPT